VTAAAGELEIRSSRSPRSTRDRLSRRADHLALYFFTGFAILYLLLPVVVIVLFSFNDPAGKKNFVWQGFTLKYWLDPLGPAGLGNALMLSLLIAFVSTIVATMLGTLIALALVRYQFRGRGATNALIFLPMATPEIVLGASLLTLFVSIGNAPFYPLDWPTILIAHIMFNISYVVVTVRARLSDFPRHLEEAAADLGANEWTTFWKVTFPLILPGIIAAGLLAFSLSIDDFVVTNFTSGNTQTFPMYIYAKNRIGIPVQVNVWGTIIFVVAVATVGISTVARSRDRSR
jgi:spermidine/putrescine transport system permease protein